MKKSGYLLLFLAAISCLAFWALKDYRRSPPLILGVLSTDSRVGSSSIVFRTKKQFSQFLSTSPIDNDAKTALSRKLGPYIGNKIAVILINKRPVASRRVNRGLFTIETVSENGVFYAALDIDPNETFKVVLLPSDQR